MRRVGRLAAATFGAAVLAMTVAGVARADTIDGNWCASDGRSLSITGPRIVTPGGRTTTGDYDRHAFSYRVPDGEPGAGATIAMTLLDEYTMNLRAAASGGEPGPVQVWKRCTRVTS